MKALRRAEKPTRSSSGRRPHPYRAARVRLVVVNLLVVAGILALMAVAVYAWEIHATDQQVNDQLYEHARHALVEGSHENLGLGASVSGTTDGSEANDTAAEQYEPSSPDVFTVVVNRRGVVTFDPGNVRALGLPDAPALLPILSGRQPSTLVTLGDDQNAYRIYSLPIRQHGQIIGALQVGMSLAARHRQLHDLLLILSAVGGGVLIITGAASFYLAGRALHPMRVAYERQRRFAAAASHELRTPLAIVRSEAELIARGLHRLTAPPSSSQQVMLSSATHRKGTEAGDAGVATQPVGHDAPSAYTGERPPPDASQLAVRLGEDVQEIVAEVDYMARLVDDLLLLARDEAAPDRFLRGDVDLVAVTTEVLAKLAPISQASGLTLRAQGSGMSDGDVDDAPASFVVHGDRDRLKQLVLILVDNAIRYTPTGGIIEVTVRRARERHLLGHEDLAMLSVRDTGPGIAQEDLPHLFEPFYRAKSARTGGIGDTAGGGDAWVGKPEGAGLGLAVARWIVLAHDGTISAAAEPGRGATFTVSLPLAERRPHRE